MKVHRKGTNDAIALRLKLNQKTTEELQQILLRRDPAHPRRYLSDTKTRNAATAVLRVRGVVEADYPPDKTVHRVKLDGPPIEGRPPVPMTCIPTGHAKRLARLLSNMDAAPYATDDLQFLQDMIYDLGGPK